MFYRLKQLILIGGDLCMLYAGLYLGVTLRYLSRSDDLFAQHLPFLTPLFGTAIVMLFIAGLYDVGRARNTTTFFQKIIFVAGLWFFLAVLYFYTNPTVTLSPKTTLLLTTFLSYGLLAVWRATYNRYLSTNLLKTPVIFIGNNREITEIINTITHYPERGYVAAGVVGETSLAEVPSGKNLDEVIAKNGGAYPGLIVISENAAENNETLSQLYRALYQQVSILPLADFYEDFYRRIPPFTFSEDWFILHLQEQSRKMYDRFRILIDLVAAAVMGIFFVVTLPLIAIAIKITSSGPIFFKQERVGRLGRKFMIYKYRTMKSLTAEGSAETSGPQFAAVNDSRITAVGNFLRKTRLDEVPQFLNILRREMGIIGPRPERPEFVEELTTAMPFYALRHLVKPGLTGWAQLQQSYYGTIEENLTKLEYDLYYIKNRSLVLDLAILLRTVSVLIRFMGR